jgi:CBS domain-containing protein
LIHLSVIADAEETILNKCHEGAILVCVLFRKNNYRMTAKREESIIYAIPIAVLDRL